MRSEKHPQSFISIQNRDTAFLCGLFESRIMTASHAADIHFGGHLEAARKRLRKLRSAGFISERERRVSEPSIYFISRQGIFHLMEHGLLSDYPIFELPALVRRVYVSELTIRHELAVMDVKTAFFREARSRPDFEIRDFCTWPRLLEFEAAPPGSSLTMVRPDGFALIRELKADGTMTDHSLFLEIDQSTETLDTLVHRARCYFQHYRSGAFASRNGVNRYDFKMRPFRVLFVVKNRLRQANLVKRLLASVPPIRSFVLAVTFDDIVTNPFKSIVLSHGDNSPGLGGQN